MASSLQITLGSLKNSINNIRSVAQGALSTAISKCNFQNSLELNFIRDVYGLSSESN